MRKRVLYWILAVAVLVGGALAVWWVCFKEAVPKSERILAAYREGAEYGGLTLDYPLDGTLFPPEIIAPTFRWVDERTDADTWLVVIKLAGRTERMSFLTSTTEWTPPDAAWEEIKRESREQEAEVAVLGVDGRRLGKILSGTTIRIGTSADEVAAPLFYREVHLPFIEAVADPARHIRWRFGTIDTKEMPPVVLEGLPNCANCHSFTADGTTLAMEVDSANDKGSYVIAPVEEEMVFDEPKIMTWAGYRREEKKKTFGLLPQISPDGRHAICMVKDRSVFVDRPDLAFSQLFFPIRGILVYYDVEARSFHALPGADDPEYVQANPTWSPDGKSIVFARSKAYHLKHLTNDESILLEPSEVREFTEEGEIFRYDLYKIPFNEGRGGKPEPLAGASNNGASNFFAKYSPDGRWIVFCKANSFMLLQPDSELYIIPAEGGQARRLECNTRRMNSWHSWSPNGKWLAFSSKAYSPYTQLCLTHIDEEGRSTPAVVLTNFSQAKTAVNIPEFVNAPPGAIKRIREEFLTEHHFYRAALHALRDNDFDAAERSYRKVLEFNPSNVAATGELAAALFSNGKAEEAKTLFQKAVELDPDYAEAYVNLGNILVQEGNLSEATEACREAVRLRPEDAVCRMMLGKVLMAAGGQYEEAMEHLDLAIRFNPRYADARKDLDLADAALAGDKLEEAARHYQSALEKWPKLALALMGLASIRATADDEDLRDGQEAIALATEACNETQFRHVRAMSLLAAAYAEAGKFEGAVYMAERALRLAQAVGSVKLEKKVRGEIDLYRQEKPLRRLGAASATVPVEEE